MLVSCTEVKREARFFMCPRQRPDIVCFKPITLCEDVLQVRLPSRRLAQSSWFAVGSLP